MYLDRKFTVFRGLAIEGSDARRGFLLQQKMGALEAASMTDPLTGLRNRRGLELALKQFDLLEALRGGSARYRSFQTGQ